MWCTGLSTVWIDCPQWWQNSPCMAAVQLAQCTPSYETMSFPLTLTPPLASGRSWHKSLTDSTAHRSPHAGRAFARHPGAGRDPVATSYVRARASKGIALERYRENPTVSPLD